MDHQEDMEGQQNMFHVQMNKASSGDFQNQMDPNCRKDLPDRPEYVQ